MRTRRRERSERRWVLSGWINLLWTQSYAVAVSLCDYHQSPLDVFNKLRRVDAALFFFFNFRKKRKSSDAFSVPSTCNGVFIISSLPFASKRLEKKAEKSGNEQTIDGRDEGRKEIVISFWSTGKGVNVVSFVTGIVKDPENKHIKFQLKEEKDSNETGGRTNLSVSKVKSLGPQTQTKLSPVAERSASPFEWIVVESIDWFTRPRRPPQSSSASDKMCQNWNLKTKTQIHASIN